MSKGLLVSGVLLLTVAAAGLRAGQVPQDPAAPPPSSTAGTADTTPTFKATIEYVEVDVVVTDKKGKAVRDLTRDDFQVFEDGKRQDISSFTVVDIPTQPADRPVSQLDAIEPDTASNARPFSGRLYVAVLDDINIAFLRSQLVKNAARQFIDRNLGANDLMAIVSTGGRSDWTQDFTSDKRLLLNAVDRFMGRKLRSAALPSNDAYVRQSDDVEASRSVLTAEPNLVRDPEAPERLTNQSRSLNTIRNVADWFGGIRGRRKTMLLFSEGIPFDITNLTSQDALSSLGVGAIMADTQGAIAAATRSNISIYGIDPRGATTMGDEDITVSSLGPDPRSGSVQARLNRQLWLEQISLRTISDETGGFAVVNTNQFANAFQRIVDDNSAYYLLAYYPQSNKRDGKFHKIEVKTARPGLTIRSRRGYQAPRGKAPEATPATDVGRPSPELQEALNSPIPVSSLPMRVFAAPFRGTAPNASVLFGVDLAGSALSLAHDSTIEFSYLAVDAQGKARAASTDTFTTALTPETKARAQQSGLRMLNRIALPPGRYALRLAARDVVAGKTGSITYDLEVPDFSKPALTMGGIIMTSMSGSALVTVKGDDQVKAMLPASPIAARTFPQSDEITLFAEIYDNQTGPAHTVGITTTIQADDGRVLFKAEDERSSSELQGGKGGYGYTLRIPLNEIAPGAYLLRLQARSSVGNADGVGRRLRIVVTE